MVGTVEDFLARKDREDEDGPAGFLNSFDQDIVGGPVRIEMPFVELYRIRQVGDMLAAFNNRIQTLTRLTSSSPRSILLELHNEAWAINQRIRALYPEVYPSRTNKRRNG